jgi:hypothetical protein
MYSVPVQIDSHHGIGELKGVLRFDGEQLLLQYQVADMIRGDFRTAPVDLPLAIDNIAAARYGAGFLWLRPWIELRMSDIAAVAGLPAAEAGRLRMRVPGADRRDARKIVDGVNAMAAELRFSRLDASISRMSTTDPLGSAAASRQMGGPARERSSE